MCILIQRMFVFDKNNKGAGHVGNKVFDL
jgi:hypothetical protein